MSLRLNSQFLLVGATGTILSSLLIFLIPGPLGLTGPGSIPANVVAILSGLLLLAGLPALYRAQAKQIRRIGLIGIVLLEIAIVATLVLYSVEFLDVAIPGLIPHPGGHGPPPAAIIPAILGIALLFIGSVIVGITTIRAHVLPAAIGWVILIGSVLLIATFPLNGILSTILINGALVVLFAGLAWAGASLSFRGNPAQTS